MARIDGHGPKPTIQFINEWSELKRALAHLKLAQEHSDNLVAAKKVDPSVAVGYTVLGRDIDTILYHVPVLMDAYAELWELMEAAIKAREQQEESKNDIYVPDAAELVAGLANPGRTRR